MRNVYVVRHTQSLHHVLRLGGGWYDTSLTEKGRADANAIARALKAETGLEGILVYSSDLKRCSETAAVFSGAFKSAVRLDEDLREMRCGEAEGKAQD